VHLRRRVQRVGEQVAAESANIDYRHVKVLVGQASNPLVAKEALGGVAGGVQEVGAHLRLGLAACSAERQLQVEPQRPALLSRPDDTHAAEQRRQLLFRLLRRRVRDRMAPLS